MPRGTGAGTSFSVALTDEEPLLEVNAMRRAVREEINAILRAQEHDASAEADDEGDAPTDEEEAEEEDESASTFSQDVSDSDDEEEGSFPELYAAVVGPVLDDSGNWIGHNGGDEQLVEQMLREGADVNVQTPQGWTPLMVSGSTGQPTMMRLLLRWGAKLEAKDRQGNGVLAWTRHRVVGHEDDIMLTVPTTEAHAQCEAMFALARQPWSPANHHLFPAAQRAAAADYLRMGVLLSHRPSAHGGPPLGRAFLDAFMECVLPHAVVRE